MREPTILLKEAILQGERARVQELLDQGVDINTRDNLHGRTFLQIAAEFDQAEILEDLIARGASPHASDYNGRKAIEFTVMYGRVSALAVLLPHMTETELHRALKVQVRLGRDSEAAHLWIRRHLQRFPLRNPKTLKRVSANVGEGICYCENGEPNLSFHDFYAALPTLPKGKTLYSMITEEEGRLLDEEYRIQPVLKGAEDVGTK